MSRIEIVAQLQAKELELENASGVLRGAIAHQEAANDEHHPDHADRFELASVIVRAVDYERRVAYQLRSLQDQLRGCKPEVEDPPKSS